MFRFVVRNECILNEIRIERREQSRGRAVRSYDTRRGRSRGRSRGQLKDTNLEIIGECGSGGVRGSFLPVEAVRLPSPSGEQPLDYTEEFATRRRQ
ncbi:hypothetical protein RR48_09122 [Papilio machaon]|uniref:Uncharacterized protein n=1 Tax=Papilio machaon TaxID=76193 RepID=A0A194RCU9_PAPMA|nr:hypothetical protein RR48_09122 [Papilio machaon]